MKTTIRPTFWEFTKRSAVEATRDYFAPLRMRQGAASGTSNRIAFVGGGNDPVAETVRVSDVDTPTFEVGLRNNREQSSLDEDSRFQPSDSSPFSEGRASTRTEAAAALLESIEASKKHLRDYEVMLVVRPDIEEAECDKLIEGISANVIDGGGEVKSIEKMGRRHLPHTVRKFNDGFYILLNVAAVGSLITEIERRLRVSEQVIKFITVRVGKVEKRIADIKARRDSVHNASWQPQVTAAPVESATEQSPTPDQFASRG